MKPVSQQRVHDVRRLRDMLRAAVQGGHYPDGHLPSEAELMASHQASRATVRQALTLLRAEGLIERTQGIGTHTAVKPVKTSLPEAHGVIKPSRDSLLNQRMRPRELDRSVVPAPPTAAERLGVAPGTPCLRLEYVALHDEEPIAVATNYVLFPEAGQLLGTPFVSDWYRLLDDARVELSDSEFIFDCELADALLASVLGIREGAPLILMEQLIYAPDGRPFDLAFIHTRGERFRFVSRGTKELS
ncbi:GntR family transcriptional regulator [Amycolatopsis bartoniae]|uniref:GntR family transcriptional regulator n=1 Tax=Amycolatopsis bartoniae TaxID=941986 RepID=A0A8H9MER0_9PSEU|nr:GntR family transcriptional regulator [Amycolatopsis bartoniae]MBB2936092.1 GntR family transcriptional regulator [Amycolatopsis bartoniae]GHF64103.1 GntR family transcriptional regulator [Amycolatopsis bartoniae]